MNTHEDSAWKSTLFLKNAGPCFVCINNPILVFWKTSMCIQWLLTDTKYRAQYTWFKVILSNICVRFTVILPLLYGNPSHNLFSSKFWHTWSNKLNSFPVFGAKSWYLSSITSMCHTTQYLFLKMKKNKFQSKVPKYS